MFVEVRPDHVRLEVKADDVPIGVYRATRTMNSIRIILGFGQHCEVSKPAIRTFEKSSSSDGYAVVTKNQSGTHAATYVPWAKVNQPNWLWLEPDPPNNQVAFWYNDKVEYYKDGMKQTIKVDQINSIGRTVKGILNVDASKVASFTADGRSPFIAD